MKRVHWYSASTTNVQWNIYLHVQISILSTTCIRQPLLSFWSNIEQNWTFALIVVALKITHIVLQLYCLH